MHRVSVRIAETNMYIRTCAVTLLHYYIVHIPVPVPLACCGLLFDLITANTAQLTRGGLTVRWTHREGVFCLSVWKPCRAHWRGRKKIFRQCRKGTTCRYAIYQLKTLTHNRSTLISHQPLPRTQLTWGNSTGRRAHREAACCPSRWTLCRAHGSGGDGCREGEQSNTPQTLTDTEKWWQFGTTL